MLEPEQMEGLVPRLETSTSTSIKNSLWQPWALRGRYVVIEIFRNIAIALLDPCWFFLVLFSSGCRRWPGIRNSERATLVFSLKNNWHTLRLNYACRSWVWQVTGLKTKHSVLQLGLDVARNFLEFYLVLHARSFKDVKLSVPVILGT